MGNFFNALFKIIADFFRPVVAIFTAITSAVALLLGAILDPGGAVNTFICKMIDIVDAVLPQTPNNLKIGSLVSSVGNAIPFVGSGIVYQTFQMAITMLSVVILIKVYKLIPFKAT